MSRTGEWNAAQKTALDWLDEQRPALSRDHMTLWDFHEPSWREYRPSQWYVDRLRQAGFEVEQGSAGMPTAFCARWRNGNGPTVAGYAEYDAVPGQSQAPVPYRKPRDGVSKFAAGHTDPHSALGMGSFSGFLAARQAMERHGIGGTLVFFGEPAEKMCASKPIHAAHGYYRDLDAAISFHPHSFPALTNGCFWETSCAPYWSRIYTFECQNPETWQSGAAGSRVACPCHGAGSRSDRCGVPDVHQLQDDEGIDAAAYRQLDLNEFIPIAGQAAADNIAPAISQIQYSLRAPMLGMCEAVFKVLDSNADHIARDDPLHRHQGVDHQNPGRPAEPGHGGDHLPQFRAARSAAMGRGGQGLRPRGSEETLGLEPMTEPFLDETMVMTPPWQAEEAFRKELPAWQMNYAADDYVDYSWHARRFASMWRIRNWPSRRAVIAIPRGCATPWAGCRPVSIRCGPGQGR